MKLEHFAALRYAHGEEAYNLKLFKWQHLPKGLYPFDLPADDVLEKAKIWR